MLRYLAAYTIKYINTWWNGLNKKRVRQTILLSILWGLFIRLKKYKVYPNM